jgi:hypothetical protein
MELFKFFKKISKDFIHRFLSLQTGVKKKGDPIEGGCSFGTITGKCNWMIYMFQVHLILISSIKINAIFFLYKRNVVSNWFSTEVVIWVPIGTFLNYPLFDLNPVSSPIWVHLKNERNWVQFHKTGYQSNRFADHILTRLNDINERILPAVKAQWRCG